MSVTNIPHFTIRTALAAVLAAGALAAEAQNAPAGSGAGKETAEGAPVVRARFEPDSVGIGDAFLLRVEVEKDIVQQIGFPQFDNNKLGDVVEIMEESACDTLAREGRRVTLGKSYRLISFDEGIYRMGHFPMLYMDKNITDTLYSRDSLNLFVGTYQIDTATQTIYDILPPMETPFRPGEISGYVLWGLLGAAVLGVLAWLLVKYRRRLPGLGPKPKEPPHVIAIKALEALHNQKVWQNNRHKLYYTRLTDILREYLTGRFGMRAMEMTSDEIMEAVRGLDLPARSAGELNALLRTADLVKFAKHVPEAEENESSYLSAYYFVEETKEATETAIESPDTPVEPVTPADRKAPSAAPAAEGEAASPASGASAPGTAGDGTPETRPVPPPAPQPRKEEER